MSVVANVAVNLDATSVVQRLKQIRDSAIGAGDAFKKLTSSAQAVKSAVEASGGGFAKASTVVGVFAAKVKNTENAIRAQIAALRAVQASVQLGGALYQKAAGQIKQYEDALRKASGAGNDAGGGIEGLKGKIAAFVGGLALATTAINVVKRSLSAAFERGQAETRLRALTSAYGETAEATSLAAAASDKFGLTQTEATKAIGDVYGRLRPLGFSLKEISGVYDGFNTLTMQAGLSSAEASSVFTQLAQSLGSGTLRGDEFNRMAESMPSILGVVAKELGVSQTALRGMAADGKITSDIVVRALQKVAETGGNLDKFLDPSTKAMNELAKNTEDAQVAFGNLLKPAAIGVLNGISEALKFTASNLKQIAQTAVFFAAFAGTLKLIALGTQAWAFASNALAAGQKAAGVAAAFLQGVMNPASLATTALALGAATAASFALGKAMDGAAADAAKVDVEVQKAAAATAKAKEAAEKMNAEVERTKEKTKQLKEAQDAVTKAIETSSQAIDKMADAQTTAIDQALSVTNARIEAEKALNNVLLEQAQRQLDGANSQQERVKAAGRILELTIEQAKLEKESAYATIEAENTKIEIAVAAAKLKEQEVKLAVELARIQGTVLQAHYDTLAAATELVSMAVKQQSAGREIAKYQKQTADANFKGAESAAKAAYQSNITVKSSGSVAANTTKATDAADKFAGSMKNAAGAAKSTADAVASMNASMNRNTLGITLQGFSSLEPWMERQIAEQKQAAIAGAGRDPIRAYTAGVTAEIQARSEFQRVIDARQMAQDEQAKTEYYGQTMQSSPNLSMERLKVLMAETAARAAAASAPTTVSPQINVTTGPVIRQDNQDYVTMTDLERAMQQTATGVITSLQTPAGRYTTGIR